MTDRPDAERSSIDLDDFHEWVERTAENEGTSPEAIIQQLMSTYWILNELTQTLEETPYEHLLEPEDGDTGSGHDAADSAASADKSEIVDVIEAIAELNSRPEAAEPPGGGSIDPQLIDIIEAIHRHAGGDAEGSEAGFTYVANQLDRLREEVSTLERDVGDVERRVETVEAETAGAIDDVLGQVEAVEGRTEALDSRLDSVDERFERELTTLRATIDRLEDALSTKADEGAVADVRSQLQTQDAETRERIDSVEERFEAAYADIRQILEYLLDSSGEQEAVLDVLVDSYESEIEEVLDVHRDTQRLREVKAAANRQGVSTAVCEACGESFDVSLLVEPRCPHCDRDIDRFDEESSFLWRTTTVAKPRPERPERGDRTLRERIQAALEARSGTELADGDRP